MNPTFTFNQRFSLAIYSAGGLALEITLTRLLSTLYYPPYIFAVLALAVLGIGIGAAAAGLIPRLQEPSLIPVWMILTGAVSMALAPLLVWVATIDVDLLLSLMLMLPYVLVGLTLTTFFNNESQNSQTLYAFDLVGAGIGAFSVIILLNLFGALHGLLAVGLIFLGAGVIHRVNALTFGSAAIGTVVLLILVTADLPTVDFTDLTTQKPITESLSGEGEILETRWDAFARTDLVAPPENQPYRLYIDGAAASVIPPAADNDFLMSDIGLFAFATALPRSVFSIGGGGGLDVWFAKRIGAEEITTVEANPQSIALTRDYADYNGGIYDQPGVRVLADEGRSVLRREDRLYDLIYLSQVVSLTAERSGYALTENAVFTLEAFEDYWDHLTDEGVLALKVYDEPTLSRTLSIVIEMLNRQGMDDIDALHHTVTLIAPATTPPTPLMIVRKTPFTRDEAIAIGRSAQRVGFASLYLPGVQADPPLDAVESGTNTYQEVIETSPLELSAPTDNRPFFYQFEKGLPTDLQPVAQFVSGFVLILLIGLGGLQWRMKMPGFTPSVLYFSALGIGFMLVEITLIQNTRLFMGHPTWAVTVVLASLLISGGLGSAWSRRLDLTKSLWLPVLMTAIITTLWVVVWPQISISFRSESTLLRMIVVIASIIPVGFVMGIPFASGLTLTGRLHPRYVPLAWSINGVMTVVGSLLGVVLSLLYGYQSVMFTGTGAYLVGALAAYLLIRALPRITT